MQTRIVGTLAPLVLLVGTSFAHAQQPPGHNGGSSASASGDSYASAWVGGGTSEYTSSSSGSGDGTCRAWGVGGHNIVWKVSTSGGCGCKWRIDNKVKKWMCPVNQKVQRKN
jgi:hypothetical protein